MAEISAFDKLLATDVISVGARELLEYRLRMNANRNIRIETVEDLRDVLSSHTGVVTELLGDLEAAGMSMGGFAQARSSETARLIRAALVERFGPTILKPLSAG